jgi:2-keto-4-pentenoate hydratase/2-oxohepta-3-ene-1,7-dioic acid hydratase in catechol pathway
MKDEIPDPAGLAIRLEMNGRVLQESNTGDMIFDIPALVSQLSRSMTLLPGTVIMTGTPAGVGFTRRPPVFLRAGDEVAVYIERIGCLANPVVLECG